MAHHGGTEARAVVPAVAPDAVVRGLRREPRTLRRGVPDAPRPRLTVIPNGFDPEDIELGAVGA